MKVGRQSELGNEFPTDTMWSHFGLRSEHHGVSHSESINAAARAISDDHSRSRLQEMLQKRPPRSWRRFLSPNKLYHATVEAVHSLAVRKTRQRIYLKLHLSLRRA